MDKNPIPGRNESELEGVSLLGNQHTQYYTDYNPEVLETFVNKHPDNDYLVSFDAYEFTSTCVAGDTLISVVREGKVVQIPIRELVDTEGDVLCFNPKTLEIVRRKYHNVRCTQKAAKVLKLTIAVSPIQKHTDPDFRSLTPMQIVQLVCTPEHPIFAWYSLGSGEYLPASRLNLGTHLYGGADLNCKLLDVKQEETRQDVYNMEVEEFENYFANGIVVHNCPKTHQPDFAKVVINYIPNERMVESKSLKLYLFSFRNHGDFHEDCVNIIMKDLIKLMDPKYIEVLGIFAPRGGISIYPFASWVNPKFSKYEKLKESRQLAVFDMTSKRQIKYDM